MDFKSRPPAAVRGDGGQAAAMRLRMCGAQWRRVHSADSMDMHEFLGCQIVQDSHLHQLLHRHFYLARISHARTEFGAS